MRIQTEAITENQTVMVKNGAENKPQRVEKYPQIEFEIVKPEQRRPVVSDDPERVKLSKPVKQVKQDVSRPSYVDFEEVDNVGQHVSDDSQTFLEEHGPKLPVIAVISGVTGVVILVGVVKIICVIVGVAVVIVSAWKLSFMMSESYTSYKHRRRHDSFREYDKPVRRRERSSSSGSSGGVNIHVNGDFIVKGDFNIKNEQS